MPLTLSITYTEGRKGWMLGMSKITWSHMEVSKLLLPDPGSPHPPSGKSKIGVTVARRLPPPPPRGPSWPGHWARIGGSAIVDAAAAGVKTAAGDPGNRARTVSRR